MQILEHRDERPGRREALEQLARAPVELVQREGRVRKADRGRHPVDHRWVVDERGDLAACDLRSVLAVDTGSLGDHLDQRPEGDSGTVLQASAAQGQPVPLARERHHLLDQPRLPGSGVRHDLDEAAGPLRDRFVEQAGEERELVCFACCHLHNVGKRGSLRQTAIHCNNRRHLAYASGWETGQPVA